MKIISWNLNHRTLEKPIPATVIDSLQHLDADIVVLNEYVDGPSRAEFKDNLNGIGYGHLAVSTHYPKHNQVLIASRHAITEGDLEAPNLTLPAKSNFLHVKLADQTLEVVGARPPAYKTKRETEAY